MTSAQKIIKYCAIAFAIFLIVSIVSGILGAVSGVSYFLSGKTTVTEMETFPITSSVKELKIDLSAARLRLQTGDRFQLIKLYPEGNAETRIPMRGRGILYLYCNRHGLMKQKLP